MNVGWKVSEHLNFEGVFWRDSRRVVWSTLGSTLKQTERSSLETCGERIGMSGDLDQWVLTEEVYDDISAFLWGCRGTVELLLLQKNKKGENHGKNTTLNL